MPRDESKLKSALMKQLHKDLPSWVHLRHEDVRSSGHPDISTTGIGKTTWLEVKHGTPRFDSTGIQELTMLRLAAQGSAFYLIYLEDGDGENKRTMIVPPKGIKSPDLGMTTYDAWFLWSGYDHASVTAWLKSHHA